MPIRFWGCWLLKFRTGTQADAPWSTSTPSIRRVQRGSSAADVCDGENTLTPGRALGRPGGLPHPCRARATRGKGNRNVPRRGHNVATTGNDPSQGASLPGQLRRLGPPGRLPHPIGGVCDEAAVQQCPAKARSPTTRHCEHNCPVVLHSNITSRQCQAGP